MPHSNLLGPIAFASRCRDLSDNLRQIVKERLTLPARAIPMQWKKRIEIKQGDRICLFVTVLRAGFVLPHAQYQARAWTAAGFRVVLIGATDAFDRPLDAAVLDMVDGVILRDNRGYDFGAWSAAIQALPSLRDAALLVTANDSVFGPFDGFTALLERVENSSADLVGLTDSAYHRHHFQSYMLFYKPAAIRSSVFQAFWRRVRTGDRWMVILRYETRLLELFTRGGVSAEALFLCSDGPPPTLKGWRTLIKRGFPFVKVQLLRDNPFGDDIEGWQDVMRAQGYDPALCETVLNPVPS